MKELGLAGTLGVALIVAAGIAYFAALRPLEERMAMLQARAASLLDAQPARRVTREKPEPDGQLARFYQFFDQSGVSLTDYLARLQVLAGKTGVELRRADYRLAPLNGSRLSAYEITLPVSGGYAQVRSFMEGALATFPAMSLDQMRITRRRVDEGLIEVELKLTFHLLKS